jgi:hypothetical protein
VKGFHIPQRYVEECDSPKQDGAVLNADSLSLVACCLLFVCKFVLGARSWSSVTFLNCFLCDLDDCAAGVIVSYAAYASLTFLFIYRKC